MSSDLKNHVAASPFPQVNGTSLPTSNGNVPNIDAVPLAVVGMAFKFPQGLDTADSFWEALCAARSAWSPFPSSRLNSDGVYDADEERLNSFPLKGAHFVDGDVGAFDAPFFTLGPAEAAEIDPQARTLLETTYHALENAGIPISTIAGTKTSVHTGTFAEDYKGFFIEDPQFAGRYAASSLSPNMLANRISWFYDLRGESVNMDTACSSTLVALHAACQGLRTRSSDTAIMAGANLFLSPDTATFLNNQGFLSPDGRCFSFDERANGYGRGEGFGAVILKRYDDALRDKDSIRAIIRATGTNQDGRTPGIVQPSPEAQSRLIKETYRKAGVDMRLTKYVEAHGTGTAVGDPIEAAAIADAFGEHISPENPLYVGTVKSNIGHLEGASGVAGMIKSILMLERGTIPGIAGLETLNKTIEERQRSLKFPRESCPWPTDGQRRLSISSFGFGGTNAHVVMDDSAHYLHPHDGEIPNGKSIWYDGPRLLVFSAQDEDGISRLETAYNEHHARTSDPHNHHYLSQLAFTLSERRSALLWRSFAICRSPEHLKDGLKLSPPVRSISAPRLALCFTGQGAQWYAMGRELETYESYSRSLVACAEELKSLGCTWDLHYELSRAPEDTRVNEPEISQTLCTALQLSLVDLLESTGVQATVAVGHSSGEIAAAYALGALDRRSALVVAYHRGRLASRLARDNSQPGGMLAVGISETEITPYFEAVSNRFGKLDISVGCINSPRSITVTGDKKQIEYLRGLLENDSVFARGLAVTVAYHSKHMQAIAEEYGMAIGTLDGRVGRVAAHMISSVTGDIVSPAQVGQAGYWVKNMVSPVRFAEAFAKSALLKIADNNTLLDTTRIQFDDVLEIGPHALLQRPVKDILASVSSRGPVPGYTSALIREESATETLLAAIGHLHSRGHYVDISVLNQIPSSIRPLINLPSYPFNHTRSYWREPRISKGHRFRQNPRHDFLGLRVPDFNPGQAKWRRRLRLSEDPWLEDHVIARVNILPAAMAIAMAVEGLKSLAAEREKNALAGYLLKDVRFLRPVTLSADADGVEVEFYLSATGQEDDRNESWRGFQLYCLENDSWVEAARGKICGKYEDDQGQVDRGLETLLESEQHAAELVRLQASCQRRVDMSRLYQALAANGVDYGPTHQCIKTSSYTDNDNGPYECHAAIDPHSHRAKSRKFHQNNFTIHPTTLDGLFHLNVVPMTKGGSRILPSVVAGIRRMFISEKGIAKNKDQDTMLAWNKSAFSGSSNVASDVVAFDASGTEALVVLEGLEARYLKEEQGPHGQDEMTKRLCWNFDSKPDIELLSHDELYGYVNEKVPMQSPPVELDLDVKTLVYICILRSLKQLTSDLIETMAPHQQRYVSWMQYEKAKFAALDENSLIKRRVEAHLHDDTFYSQLLDTLEAHNNQTKLFAVIARNLPAILQGSVDPVDLTFKTPLVKEYYREVYENSTAQSQALHFIDIYAHKYPRLKVLEIGAGTGGMTKDILDTLTKIGSGESGRGTPRFDHYTYTDISAGFFTDAAALFEAFPEKVSFQVLDIEKDPAMQGFEAGAYDLIIADNVFHATRDLDATVKHARKLLKPDGKLVLFELTSPDVTRLNFAFGVLPGWWRFEDQYRELSAGAEVTTWNHVLSKNGFAGIELEIKDYAERESQEHSVLISTAVKDLPQQPSLDLPRTAVVYDVNDPVQKAVSEMLLSRIQELGADTAAVSLDDAAQLARQGKWFFVVILELGDGVLSTLDANVYSPFKKLLEAADGMLWVCRGGGFRPQLPEHAMIQGAFRGIRLEELASKFISLSLDPSSTSPARMSDLILRAFDAVVTRHVNECEQEYVERHGRLCVDRLIEADYINEKIPDLTAEVEEGESAFGAHKALRLNIATPGLLDTLQFIDDESTLPPLGPDEIEIKVEACGVNFRDCLIALGRIAGDRFGFECAGTVCRKGSEVRDLNVGDRVCASAIGTYQTYARCKASDAIPIPDGMNIAEAAALPIVFGTAYYALIHVADIQPGETILIHSAAGGTGQAAIQIAKLRGAVIFVTVGSEEKKKLLMDLYEISAEHIFDSRNASFAKGIHRMTGGRGVDVVLNSLSGDLLVSSWECVAPFGRFLELGKKDILGNGDLPMRPFERNASFHAIDLNEARRYRPALLQRLQKEIGNLIADHQVTPPRPIHVYPVSEVEQAFRYLQGGKNTGKTVIEIRGDDVVKTKLNVHRPWSFDANATYVIAGGLGGIGRATARWMANRGAKNLLLLSRSRPNTEAQQVIEAMENDGVHVEVRACDISDFERLKVVLEDIGRTMPPIKGCIQSAMVLRNKVFANMTYTDWEEAVPCKVAGTWNLHSLLPSGLDFFITYSSIVGGIGGTAAVNYAAACVYQDALVHYRNGLGERATTLNLGVMLDDGVLRDNDAVRNALTASGYPIGISQKEMFALLEYHCDPSLEIPDTPLRSQVLVGLNTPLGLAAEGREIPVLLNRPLFSGTWNIVDSSTSATTNAAEDTGGNVDVLRQLATITSMQDATDIIAESLMQRLSKAIGVPLKNLDAGKPMNQYGVDSLVAVELRNWFKWKLDADIAVFEMLGKMSFEEMGRIAAGKSLVVKGILSSCSASDSK
ncbi:type I polyketide synthase [Aspergillus mulundensis]|uniref:Uncharacterized protein n=1 Tax=Aspergillus mulundensis TaxID=1810919 RepID=A0A3D8T5J2_9EURO|nr:Uncharacterized protein DSM5745_01121 [Aspergillus mulundensis]RDW93799.1 Uncharacterized protein DSM5745_01121 [Aspergillus mulundensis]